jgi:Ca2+-binding RTX toxin-like protein
VISAATLASLGLGDGPKSVSITLSVSDGDKGASAPASLTVNNVKPTASINVPSGIIINPAALTFLASDPSLADVAAGFKYTINWGDGTAAQTVNATANNGSGKTISHSYALLGTYTVTATATDKDGGVSAPVSVTISVSGAQLQPDPSEPTKNALFVYGSAGPDVIRFAKSGGGINVVLDSMNAGTFKGFTRVIAYGFAGNDDIQLFDAQAVFFGGDGNDTLIAGNFPTILVGGAGNDALTASGNSKDMLIGGLGADVLNGGSGEDVLLAGRTTYDNGSSADIKALTAILNEWSRGSSYSTSIAHITGTQSGGLNGTSLFSTSGPSQNVFDDNDVDVLVGGNGRDWMIYHSSGPGVLDQADLDGTEIGTNITI